jgi:hypothetical protein
MSMPEKTCVSCGERFTLLPNKPGLVNTCPRCSVPQVESEIIERKPRKRRQKTTGEEVHEQERKLHRSKKLKELIFGKGSPDVTA